MAGSVPGEYANLAPLIGPIEIFNGLQKLEGRLRSQTSCYDAENPTMKHLLNQLVARAPLNAFFALSGPDKVANRSGAVIVLGIAAVLEAYGDSCFQSGLYRSSGAARILAFLGGAASLVLYGLVVNVPRWDFGRLLGVYVVLFFLCAQVIARLKFGQTPTMPVLAGGALIVAGGLVITIFGP